MVSKAEKQEQKDLQALLEEPELCVSPKKAGDAPVAETAAVAKAKAKAAAKAKAQKPCLVCGLVVGIHPSNSAYCADHKRAVDAYTAACKLADKKGKTTENMDAFNAIRQDCGPPPSNFSRLMLEYEERCPGAGRGKKRAHIEVAMLNQKHCMRTEMKKEFICEFMHRDQWIHHAVSNLRWSPAEAELKWNEVREKTEVSQQDFNGPNRSLRLPMHVKDLVVGSSIVSFETVVDSESKRRKITSEKDLEAMQVDAAELQEGISFKSDMFKSAGGEVASVLAQSGGSAFLQRHGAGNFQGGFAVDKEAQGSSSSTNQGGEKKSRFDCETSRLSLHADLGQKLTKLKEKVARIQKEGKDIETNTAKHAQETDAEYVPTHAQYMADYRLGL